MTHPTSMKRHKLSLVATAALLGLASASAIAAPTVSRLTPPSELFASGNAAPVIARFLPGQRFDLQATLRADDAAKTITAASFAIDGKTVDATVALRSCATGCLSTVPVNASIATVRAVSAAKPGIHTMTVTATQSDGQTVSATGNFEVVPLLAGGQKVKNIIIMLGDGMGAAQRTGARIVAGGYAQGKTITPLAMDTFPVTGMADAASPTVIRDVADASAMYVLMPMRV